MSKETIKFLRDYVGALPEDDDSPANDYFARALIKALGLPKRGHKMTIVIETGCDPLVKYEYWLDHDDPSLPELVNKCAFFEVRVREGEDLAAA